jgi:hypothetical protein
MAEGRGRSTRIIAAAFIALGCLTAAAGVAALVVTGAEHLPQIALGMVYAASAVATGVGLRIGAKQARAGYVIWWTTIFLFQLAFVDVPGEVRISLYGAYVVLLAIAVWGYSFISRQTGFPRTPSPPAPPA